MEQGIEVGRSFSCIEATGGRQGSQQDPAALRRVADKAWAETKAPLPPHPAIVQRQSQGSASNQKYSKQGGQNVCGVSVRAVPTGRVQGRSFCVISRGKAFIQQCR